MNKPVPIKGFDCVAMKHAGGARIYEEIRNLSPDERADYWKRMNEEYLQRFKGQTKQLLSGH